MGVAASPIGEISAAGPQVRTLISRERHGQGRDQGCIATSTACAVPLLRRRQERRPCYVNHVAHSFNQACYAYYLQDRVQQPLSAQHSSLMAAESDAMQREVEVQPSQYQQHQIPEWEHAEKGTPSRGKLGAFKMPRLRGVRNRSGARHSTVSRRKKWLILGGIIALLAIALIIGLAVGLTVGRKNKSVSHAWPSDSRKWQAGVSQTLSRALHFPVQLLISHQAAH